MLYTRTKCFNVTQEVSMEIHSPRALSAASLSETAAETWSVCYDKVLPTEAPGLHATKDLWLTIQLALLPSVPANLPQWQHQQQMK